MVSTTDKPNIFEIEIDGPRNEFLAFPPLQKRLRGRFDINRIAEPEAKRLLNKWPDAIPGQKIRVNLDTGEAVILDQLHDPSFRLVRQKLERQFELPPAKEEIQGVDLATMLFYMSEAVKAGVARVTAGEMPKELPGKPKTDWYIPRQPDVQDKMAEAFSMMATVVSQNSQLLQELLNRLPANAQKR